MAALFTLTLTLSHQGRGDLLGTSCVITPLDSGFRRNDGEY